MKVLQLSYFLLLLLMCSSCEGRTGYMNEGQLNTVAMLTDVEWLVVYVESWLGHGENIEDETNIYSFGKDAKGWTARASLKDPSVKENVRYFQWSFTTENYAVIYTEGNSNDGYWLIQKLTPTELWLQWAIMDPVLYPNQITTFYKLKARKRQ